MRAMTRGTVTEAWAKHHHPLWYRRVTGRASSTIGAGRPSGRRDPARFWRHACMPIGANRHWRHRSSPMAPPTRVQRLASCLPTAASCFAERAARLRRSSPPATRWATSCGFMAERARGAAGASRWRRSPRRRAADAAWLASRDHGMPPLSASHCARRALARGPARAGGSAAPRRGAAARRPDAGRARAATDAASIEAAPTGCSPALARREAACGPVHRRRPAGVLDAPGRRARTSAIRSACDVPTICPVLREPAGGQRACASAATRRTCATCTARLCATEWHMVRIKCTQLRAGQGSPVLRPSRAGTAAPRAAVRAEACDECRTLPEDLPPGAGSAASTRWPTTWPRWRSTCWSTSAATRASGPNLLFHPGPG